ncbi:unnamed protein product [Mycena citricolor]|uniref:Uncharacterized protein n=1 Tax=Mycena citricolor TaxID=2018698 RepID=A0AAD2HXM6_9AGAR|nr:unnamed protein product [Mycena citricolor]
MMGGRAAWRACEPSSEEILMISPPLFSSEYLEGVLDGDDRCDIDRQRKDDRASCAGRAGFRSEWVRGGASDGWKRTHLLMRKSRPGTPSSFSFAATASFASVMVFSLARSM